MTRRSELVRDLVAPVATFVIVVALLWLLSRMPAVCAALGPCGTDTRPRVALIAGLAVFAVFAVTVLLRVRNASGFQTVSEEVSYIVLVVAGVAGVIATFVSAGFTLPPVFIIGLAHS